MKSKKGIGNWVWFVLIILMCLFIIFGLIILFSGKSISDFFRFERDIRLKNSSGVGGVTETGEDIVDEDLGGNWGSSSSNSEGDTGDIPSPPTLPS